MNEIVEVVSNSQHTLLPIYKESINNIIGILHLRRLARFMGSNEFTKSDLMQLNRGPYYIPEATSLDKQLIRFQAEKRIALVVDEYGELQDYHFRRYPRGDSGRIHLRFFCKHSRDSSPKR